MIYSNKYRTNKTMYALQVEPYHSGINPIQTFVSSRAWNHATFGRPKY